MQRAGADTKRDVQTENVVLEKTGFRTEKLFALYLGLRLLALIVDNYIHT